MLEGQRPGSKDKFHRRHHGKVGRPRRQVIPGRLLTIPVMTGYGYKVSYVNITLHLPPGLPQIYPQFQVVTKIYRAIWIFDLFAPFNVHGRLLSSYKMLEGQKTNSIGRYHGKVGCPRHQVVPSRILN